MTPAVPASTFTTRQQDALDAAFGVFFRVSSFGASTANTAAQNTTAIQAAITAAIAAGGGIVLFQDLYPIATALTINGAVTLMGTNHLTTGIIPAVGIDGIDINTTEAVILRDFGILYASAANAGTAAITLNSATENSHSRFVNLGITNPYDAIIIDNSQQWIIEDCIVAAIQHRGVTVVNTNNPDHGDSQIINNTFTGTTSATIVLQVSSGGLRFVNNKILQASIGFDLALTNGVSTSDLFIADNSIEGIQNDAIRLRRQGATGQFLNVIITGNELEGLIGVLSPADGAGAWLLNVVVTDNVWIGSATGTNVGVSLSSVTGFVVANNTMYSNKNGTLKVATGADAINGVVGPNIGVSGATFGATSIGSAATTSTIDGAGVWTNPAVIQ